MHASTNAKERQKQWEILKSMKQMWGPRWVIEGDFNDIKNNEEKLGGKRRQESSFRDFKNIISAMEMGDIKYKGETYTWAYNRE